MNIWKEKRTMITKKGLSSKLALVAACIFLLALSAAASYATTITDGSFENCTIGEYVDGSDGHVWLSDNLWIFGANNSGSGTIVSGTQDGEKCLKFDRTSLNNDAVIYTSPYPWCNPVAVTPGQKYTVSFWAYGAGCTLNFQSAAWYSPDPVNYVVSYNGNETLEGSNSTQQNYALTSNWAQYSATFTAKAGTEVEALSFRNLTVGTMYLDNVQITALPEPGSMLALFSGFAGLAGFAIRRRK